MNNKSGSSIKKQQGKKKTGLIIAVLIPIVSVSLCYGSYLALKRAVKVGEISFSGNKYTKSRDLSSLIRIRKGDELLSLSGEEIYRRLKRSPWIKDAVVRREPLSLTEGRIEISVQEALPVAVLNRGDSSFLIDGEGVILEEMKEGTFLFLPVIREIDPEKETEAYREAINCIKILHKRRVLAYNGNVVVTGKRPEEIALNVDNISIKIGAGDLEKKLERLAFVREEIQKRNIQVESIDLRFNGKIIVKPVAQEPPVVQKKPVIKAEQKKPEPKKPEPKKAVPKKGEPQKAETKKAEPKKAEQKKAELKKPPRQATKEPKKQPLPEKKTGKAEAEKRQQH
ncbi:MAG: FtsQ-type POTRA domain-containing protein [Nitrospirales bacterium]|nr:FtsQ-type POTRA domain-containing protein [Nitrospirales bacterium]